MTLSVGAEEAVLRTAAVMDIAVPLRQLCGLWKIMLSCKGKPLPLLSWSSVSPDVRVMRTLKDDIEASEGMFAETP